nr:hypothetical protein [uncultured Rhodopila sp.]
MYTIPITSFSHRHGRACLGHLRTSAAAQMAGTTPGHDRGGGDERQNLWFPTRLSLTSALSDSRGHVDVNALKGCNTLQQTALHRLPHQTPAPIHEGACDEPPVLETPFVGRVHIPARLHSGPARAGQPDLPDPPDG